VAAYVISDIVGRDPQIGFDQSPGRAYPGLATAAIRRTSTSSADETNSRVATDRNAPLPPTTRATAAPVAESGASNTAIASVVE
jgi:hypothetical protein